MFSFFKKKSSKSNKTKIQHKLKIFPFVLVGIWTLNFLLNITIGNYFVAGMNFICVVLFSISAWIQSAEWREERKQIKFREANLAIQNKKREDAKKLMEKTNFDFWKEKESEKNAK